MTLSILPTNDPKKRSDKSRNAKMKVDFMNKEYQYFWKYSYRITHRNTNDTYDELEHLKSTAKALELPVSVDLPKLNGIP